MLKQLLNLPESETDSRLREVCQNFEARVFAKVRVADVLSIERTGIDDQLYRYSLQAHFDFVVTDDESNPFFAVEFDGRGHSKPEAQRRDRMKNELCERLELPLLRVNQKYFHAEFSNWDLLRWICTVFFIKKDWDKDIASGLIHYEDAIFDPIFVAVKTKGGQRSLELEGEARARFGELFRAGSIPSHLFSWITARDGKNVLRALAWMRTTDNEGILVETAMQYYYIGDWLQFAVRGIVLTQLATKLQTVLNGKESWPGAAAPPTD